MLGLVVQNSKGNRGKVPDAGSLGGRAGVLVGEGCLEGGARHLRFESVPDCPLSSLQGLSIPPSSSWAVLVNIPVF